MQTSNLRPGSNLNQPTEHARTGRSRLAMSQTKAQTCRFGEYKPHFVMDVVPKDDIQLRSSHIARSYTLKAPLMQNIALNRDYFVVPLQALLPMNFDKFIQPPKNGEDVDAELFGLCMSSTSIGAIITNLLQGIDAHNNEILSLRALACANMFLSRDSLLFNLEYDFSRYISDFDAFTERYLSSITSGVVTVTHSDGSTAEFDFTHGGTPACRAFFYELLEDPSVEVDVLNDVEVDYPHTPVFLPANLPRFNYARVLAYQMVCAHFYSNDNVDFVYSADLFRSYVSALCNEVTLTYSSSARWNGMLVPLDYCSSGYFGAALRSASAEISTAVTDDARLFFSLFGLFSYRRSLRFVDYFTGAKTRPIASVDVTFNVNSGVASAVDVTRSIQLQKFANAVQKTGRKLSEYVKSLFGASMSYDYSEPMYLGHTSDLVHTSEVENTGAAQLSDPNSTTAVMRGNSSRYAFRFESDCYGVLLGISYFDIKRLYIGGVSPFTKMKDRYDYFIPYMQFIGDQPIYTNELPNFVIAGSPDYFASDTVFGYCLRDMQYKTLINHCSGGFVNNLPGWCFNSGLTGRSRISPEFIRSRQDELDSLYLSLTGLSMCSYFHFILMNENEVDATRPMVYQPEILG